MEDRQVAAQGEDLTILLLGTTSLMPELPEKLEELGADVERAGVRHAAAAAVAVAPDLVVLVGDAATGGGRRVLESIAQDAAASVAPVVVVGAKSRPPVGWKHGRVAVLSGTLEAGEMAARLVALAREVPERQGAVRGAVSSRTLEPLLDSLSEGQRTGVLSVGGGQLPARAKMLIRKGRPVSEKPESFVGRVKPLLEDADLPADYEFQETTTGVDSVPPSAAAQGVPLSILKGCRVAVVESDLDRAEQLARALRGRGALAFACVDATGLENLRRVDPDVVLVDPADMEGPCSALVDSLVNDVRVRWASILSAPRSQLWPAGAAKPVISPLCAKISELLRPARELSERLRRHPKLTTRLELLGPARLLRALAEAEKTLRVTVRHPRATVHVDLQDGLVCGAAGFYGEASRRKLAGPEALAALAVMRSGRVAIESRPSAELNDINARVDLALAMADLEHPPIAPSLAPLPQEPVAGGGPAHHATARRAAAPSLDVPSATTEAGGASPGAAAPPAPSRASVSLTSPMPLSAIAQTQGPVAAVQVRPKATILGLGRPVPASSASGHRAQGAALASAPASEPESEAWDSPRAGTPALDIDLEVTTAYASRAELEALESGDVEQFSDARAEPADATALANISRAAMQRLSVALQSFGGLCAPALSRLLVLLVAARGRLQPLGERLRSLKRPDTEQVPRSGEALPAGSRPAAGEQRLSSLALLLSQAREAAVTQLTAVFGQIRLRASRRLLVAASACTALSAVVLVAWLLAGRGSPTDVETHERGRAARMGAKAAVKSVSASPDSPPAVRESHAAGSATGRTAATATAPASADSPSADAQEPDLPADRLRAWRLKRAKKFVQRATQLRRRQRLGMAEANYLKALKLWPNYPLAIAGVVRVHLQRRDGTEALRWAKRLVTMKPDRSNHHLLLGDALALNGKMVRARKAWRRSAQYGNRRAKRRLKER